jgi:hypothetical protein
VRRKPTTSSTAPIADCFSYNKNEVDRGIDAVG